MPGKSEGALSFDDALLELGVDAKATAEEVRRAYLRLVKTHSPERDPMGFRRARTDYEVARTTLAMRQLAANCESLSGPEPIAREAAGATGEARSAGESPSPAAASDPASTASHDAPVQPRPIQRALRDAGLRPEQVGEVLLVGGATRMPCVAHVVAQLFGRLPLRTLPPDEAVACGAAVQAALKAGDASVEDMVVTDVAPFTLGMSAAAGFGKQVVGGIFEPIIERGTVIPCSRVKRFFKMTDFQNQILVTVFQGEHSLCQENQKLGEYLIAGLEPKPAEQVAVDVRFTCDLNGILEVDMSIVGTERSETLIIESAPGRLGAEALHKAREAMARLKFHPRDSLPNATALARADALFIESRGAAREMLGEAIAHMRAALESQDGREIAAWRERLQSLIGNLRR